MFPTLFSFLIPLFAELSLFAVVDYVYFLQAIPLIIGVSLIYAGTRCEDLTSLLKYGLKTFLWILGFMAIGYAILVFFFHSL